MTKLLIVWHRQSKRCSPKHLWTKYTGWHRILRQFTRNNASQTPQSVVFNEILIPPNIRYKSLHLTRALGVLLSRRFMTEQRTCSPNFLLATALFIRNITIVWKLTINQCLWLFNLRDREKNLHEVVTNSSWVWVVLIEARHESGHP